MVYDADDLLDRDHSAAQRISHTLLALRRDTDYPVYLVIQSGLSTSNPKQLANGLRRLWIDGADGLVMVLQTDSKLVAFGTSFLDSSDESEPSPSYDLLKLLADVVANADANLSEAQVAEQSVNMLADGIRKLHTPDSEVQSSRGNFRLALLMTGVLSLLGLIAVLGAWCARLRHSHQLQRLGFPAIDRPERLGAPFGGGMISSRKFHRPPAS